MYRIFQYATFSISIHYYRLLVRLLYFMPSIIGNGWSVRRSPTFFFLKPSQKPTQTIYHITNTTNTCPART